MSFHSVLHGTFFIRVAIKYFVEAMIRICIIILVLGNFKKYIGSLLEVVIVTVM